MHLRKKDVFGGRIATHWVWATNEALQRVLGHLVIWFIALQLPALWRARSNGLSDSCRLKSRTKKAVKKLSLWTQKQAKQCHSSEWRIFYSLINKKSVGGAAGIEPASECSPPLALHD